MAFGRKAHTDGTPAPGTDYGTPVARSDNIYRPILIANHALHFSSSIIVLGISAYFINNYTHNTHLRYWVALVRPPSLSTPPSLQPPRDATTLTNALQAAVDTFFYLPALVLPAIKKYKGYFAPLAWLLSYLWLTAFIFAAQDFQYNGGCAANSPRGVNKCSMKHTLEAFAFIAFFTGMVGALLEASLWHAYCSRCEHVGGVEKQHGVGPAPVADTSV